MLLKRAYATTALTSLIIGFSTAWATVAYANPEGGVVSAGSAIISSTGNKLDVFQSTDRAIIDWRSFNIEVDEHTQFHQPSSSATALNRVNSPDPSHILGKLTANGNVVLVNPNGIFFGKNSRVDVNGIIASTADIKNESFMAGGRLHFDKPGLGDGLIVNEGQITAKEAGLVGLVAPNVINHGVIEAKLGRIHLASGNTMTVDLYGDGLMEIAVSDDVKSQLVLNTGKLSAAGGSIVLTAAAGKEIVQGLVIAQGELEAPAVGMKNGKISIYAEGSNAVKNNVMADKGKKSGASNVIIQASLDVSGRNEGEHGGAITVTGDNVAILNGTIMDASGHSGKTDTTADGKISDARPGAAGGDIRIGGDYLGQGATSAAQTLFVDTYTLFYNDAIDTGDAGRTIFWSDKDTTFFGNVYARGGENGGNGGFLETSGHNHLTAEGFADLTAENGRKGTYFLDPTDITIYGNFAPNYVSTDGSSVSLASNLKLWLDGSDQSTLFSDTAGTTQVTNGGTVARWNDKSGNGNNATQATAGNRPTWNSTGINGLGALEFSNNQALSGTISSTGNNLSLATVGYFNTTTQPNGDFDYIINLGNGTNNLSIARSGVNTGTTVANGLYSYDGVDARGGPVATGQTWLMMGASLSASSPYYTFYMNGTSSAVNDHAAVASTNGAYTIGGYGPGATHYLNGKLAETIIYGTALSTTNRQLVDQYQSAKWGIALNAPGTGATEVAKATAADGYSSFTTRYLERLSQTADISLQATNNITLDLKGDTLALASDRNLTLTAGNDIKTTANSAGTISTARTGSGGNITMTAGTHIDLNNVVLKTTGGGSVNLTATAGDVKLNAINTAAGDVSISGRDVTMNGGGYSMSNLMGFWRFEEGSGTTATDSSGNNNTGTLMNGATWSSTTNGIAGNTRSMNFDGTDDYITIADANSLDLTNAFTLSFWVKSDSNAQTNRYLISKRNDAGSDNVYSVLYGYSADKTQFYAGGGNAYAYPSANSNITLGDTGWHQITYTYDGSKYQSYKDGTLIGTTNLTANLSASTSTLLLGTFNAAGYYFDGLMDDVRVYNKALSGGEVALLANPTQWQTGNTIINASRDVAFDLKGDAISTSTGKNFTINAGNDILSTSWGTVTSNGAGNMTFTATRDVNITKDFDLVAAGTGAVTLRSGNSILYSGSGDITTNGGAITLHSDYHATTPNSLGAISLGSGTTLTSNNGNITLGGGTDPATGYAFGTSANALGIDLQSASLTSGSGNITMHGTGYSGGSVANSHGLWLHGASTVQSTTGNISLYGKGGSGGAAGDAGWGNIGIYTLDSGTNVLSSSGNIILDGTSGTGSLAWNAGVVIYTGSTIRTAGNGTIGITGTNTSTVGGSQIGAWLGNTNGTYVETQNGAITLSGTTTRATADSNGLVFHTSSNGLRTTGSGNIQVTGSASASAKDILFNAAYSFGSGTATGNITITADGYTVTAAPTITTTGKVTFSPRSLTTSMGVSGGAGTLSVPSTILDNVTASTVSFGRTDHNTIITMGPRNWSSKTYNVEILSAGGRIAFANGAHIMGNNRLFARTTANDVRLQSGASLSSTASGDAIVLAASGVFFNASGSTTPLTVTGGGRWMIYSGNSANDTPNGMTPDFRRYSCTYGGSCPTLGTGNAMLHANTPVLTATPNIIADLTYGDTAPTLTNYAYTLSGFLTAADDIVGAVTGSLNGTTTYTPASNAGASYDITYSGGTLTSTLGYSFTYADKTNAFGVNKATVEVGAQDATMVAGTSTPTLTYNYTGFVNGQTLATSGIAGAPILGITPSTLSAGTHNMTLNLTGLISSNYTFADKMPKGILTIQPAPPAPTPTATVSIPTAVQQAIVKPPAVTAIMPASSSNSAPATSPQSTLVKEPTKETERTSPSADAPLSRATDPVLKALTADGTLEISPEVKKTFSLCDGRSDAACGG